MNVNEGFSVPVHRFECMFKFFIANIFSILYCNLFAIYKFLYVKKKTPQNND